MAPVSAAESAEVMMGVGSWVVCSVGMLVFNKAAVTSLPLACTLVNMQLVFTALAMLTCCWSSLHIESRQDLFRWAIVIPFFAGMLLTSMFALSAASMTTVVTFRAVSPLIAMSIERFYPNPLKITPAIIGCIVVMIGGAVVYAGVMEASEFGALGWLLLNNFFAIGDRLLQRLMLAKDQNPVNMSKTAITLVNNVGGSLALFVAMAFTGEYSQIGGALAALSNMDIFWVVASCIVSVGISYTGVWAQSLIPATSFLVLVNANKFFIIFLEAFILKTKTLSATQVCGAIIVILASCAYGKAREYAEMDAKGQEKTESTPIIAKP